MCTSRRLPSTKRDLLIVCLVWFSVTNRRSHHGINKLTKNYSVSKSNYLIDASYKLNPQAQKLILACLSKIDSRHEVPKEMVISALEFAELTGLSKKNAHRELYRAADALKRTDIILIENGERIELAWLQEKGERIKGEAAVRLVWTNRVLKYISQLQNRFTTYKLKHIVDLQSSHSIRLYELLIRFNDTGIRKITVEDFKAALGISDKYEQYRDLARRVIRPSLKEINNNKKTNLIVTFETVKKGRTVAALYFTFIEKKEPQQELDLQRK